MTQNALRPKHTAVQPTNAFARIACESIRWTLRKQLRQGGHVFRAENQTFNLCTGASIDNRRFVAEVVRFHEYVAIRRNITVVTNAPADMNGASVYRETFGMRFPLAVESSLDFGL
jgi:hypothetical protein